MQKRTVIFFTLCAVVVALTTACNKESPLAVVVKALRLDEAHYQLLPIVQPYQKSLMGKIVKKGPVFDESPCVYLTGMAWDPTPVVTDFRGAKIRNKKFGLSLLELFDVHLEFNDVLEVTTSFSHIDAFRATDFAKTQEDCPEADLVVRELRFDAFEIQVRQVSLDTLDIQAKLEKAQKYLPNLSVSFDSRDSLRYTLKMPAGVYAYSTRRISSKDREHKGVATVFVPELALEPDRQQHEAKFTPPEIQVLSLESDRINDTFRVYVKATDKIFPPERIRLQARIGSTTIHDAFPAELDTTLSASAFGHRALDTFPLTLIASHALFRSETTLQLTVRDVEEPQGKFVQPAEAITEVPPGQKTMTVRLQAQDDSGIDSVKIMLGKLGEEASVFGEKRVGSSPNELVNITLPLDLSGLKRGYSYSLHAVVTDRQNKSTVIGPKLVRMITDKPPLVVINSPKERQEIPLSQGILRVEAQVTAEESLIDTVQFWVGNELRDQVINQRRESLETREFFLWNLTQEHFRGVQSISVRANNFDGRWGQAARILQIVDDRPANIFADAGTILRPRNTVMARVEGIRIARAVLLVDGKEVESVAVPDSSSLIQFALPGEVTTATLAQGAPPVVRIAGYDASGNKVSDELVSVPAPEK